MADFLEWMVESSLLIGLILGIRKIFIGKIRYAGIYALWLVVLLRFLVPVNLISTPISVGNMLSNKISDEVFVESEEPDTVDFVGFYQQPATKAEPNGNVSSLGMLSDKASLPEVENITQQQENSVQGAEKAGENKFCHLLNIMDSSGVTAALGVVGLVVSALFLSWFILSNISLLRRVKKKRLLYGKRNGIVIYAVSGIQNPCLYGFFRPAVYLPKFLVYGEDGVRADSEEIEQMITHEYVHYCHKDHVWAMFRTILVSLYWFHPFVWLAVSRSKKDAELFCDETVIRLIGEEKRFGYGKMLVRLAATARWGDFRYPLVAMSRRGREMKGRIRAISAQKHDSKCLLIPFIVLALAVAGITCSTGVRLQAGTAEKSVLSGGNRNHTASGYVGEKQGLIENTSGQFLQLGVQNQLPQYPDFYAGSSLFSLYNKSSLEKVFQDYITVFTEAVNTGNVDKLDRVLLSGSDVYTQQCNLVKNYYKREIREEVKECSVTLYQPVAPKQVAIDSDERIMVYYGDETKKLIKQKYRYTCEFVNGEWLITDMKNREEKSE